MPICVTITYYTIITVSMVFVSAVRYLLIFLNNWLAFTEVVHIINIRPIGLHYIRQAFVTVLTWYRLIRPRFLYNAE